MRRTAHDGDRTVSTRAGSGSPDMRPQRPSLPESILVLLACAVILKTIAKTASDYQNYFPPDFASDFLRGRERHFWGVYRWAFYTHILSGPVSLLLGLILVVERSRPAFPDMASASRPAAGRVRLAACDAQRSVDGLSRRGGPRRGGRAGRVGDRHRDLRRPRREVGGDATVRGSSALDVSMLRPAVLGRRAPADRRTGDRSRERNAPSIDPLATWMSWLAPLSAFEVYERTRRRSGPFHVDGPCSGARNGGGTRRFNSPRGGTIFASGDRKQRAEAPWRASSPSGTVRCRRRSPRSCPRCEAASWSARGSSPATRPHPSGPSRGRRSRRRLRSP